MLWDAILLFCFPCLVLYLENSIYTILILITLGIIWFSYSIRILFVYDDLIKITYPLRFILKRKFKEKTIYYTDISNVKFYRGRIETFVFYVKDKRSHKDKPKRYFLWLDVGKRKRDELVKYLLSKDIEVTNKPKTVYYY